MFNTALDKPKWVHKILQWRGIWLTGGLAVFNMMAALSRTHSGI